MKKRIFALSILLLMTILFFTPFLCQNAISSENNTSDTESTTETIEDIKTMDCQPIEETIGLTFEDLTSQMSADINKIPYDFNDIKQKQQWFYSYKEVIEKYPKELHATTIYDVYTRTELELLFRIVQAEVGSEYNFCEKANVVSVIFNRLNSGSYYSITDVLTAKNQFSTYWNGSYLKVEIDEKTILACEYVFLFGDTTGGCYGFQTKYVQNWNGWEYKFNDDCHYFYKIKED